VQKTVGSTQRTFCATDCNAFLLAWVISDMGPVTKPHQPVSGAVRRKANFFPDPPTNFAVWRARFEAAATQHFPDLSPTADQLAERDAELRRIVAHVKSSGPYQQDSGQVLGIQEK